MVDSLFEYLVIIATLTIVGWMYAFTSCKFISPLLKVSSSSNCKLTFIEYISFAVIAFLLTIMFHKNHPVIAAVVIVLASVTAVVISQYRFRMTIIQTVCMGINALIAGGIMLLPDINSLPKEFAKELFSHYINVSLTLGATAGIAMAILFALSSRDFNIVEGKEFKFKEVEAVRIVFGFFVAELLLFFFIGWPLFHHLVSSY